MSRKFIFRQLYTIISMICTMMALIFIIRSEINIFHFMLYRRRNYLNVDTIITQNLLPKLIFSTVLIVLGLFCYIFYLSVLRENTLLIVVRFLFISAGLISCLWEYETLFYVTAFSRVLWIRLGDLFFLLINYTFFELLYSADSPGGKRQMLEGSRILLLLEILSVLMYRPAKNILFLEIFAVIWMCICCVCLKKHGKNHELGLYAAFTVAMATVNIMYMKMRSSENLFRDYKMILLLAYVILIFSVVIYLYYYRKFHLRMCLSKDVNQKIKFANRYRYEITGKLIDAVENPVQLIESLNEILTEKMTDCDVDTANILNAMHHETGRIKKTLGYLRNNHFFAEDIYNIEKIRADMNFIIKESMRLLESEGGEVKRICLNDCSGGENFISCDPYYLSEALVNILREILEISQSDQPIQFTVEQRRMEVILELETSVSTDKQRRLAQFYRVFRKNGLQRDNYREENVYLIAARNIILLHNGKFTVHKEYRKLNLTCCLPICESWMEMDKYLPGISGEEKYRKKTVVVLVSARTEQISLVSAYLSGEDFLLKVFHDCVEAIEYLNRTPEVTLVLIGEIFSHMTYYEVCSEIRKNFSMVQLSVVLLSNKMKRHINDERLKYFNDVLEGAFSRHQLLLKVYCAMRLRESEEELSKYRIDFLQSQMNPHFIFNTISTIMPLCMNRSMEAYELLEHFAEYLRGNLFAGNLHTKITLQRELDLIEAFLEIEKVRFRNMVEYGIEISCDQNIQILPLLIEPLVENCVAHARIKDRVLHIQVNISEVEQGIRVKVCDDGKGISQEHLQELYHAIQGKSFGLSNVIKRLRLYYQRELQIISEEGIGTTIWFDIPKG